MVVQVRIFGCANNMLADGLCVLELGLSSPLVEFDLSTTHDLRVAATNLITNCVEGRGTGGLIKGLGKAILACRHGCLYVQYKS